MSEDYEGDLSPCGSCQNCGCNLYRGDNIEMELCDQCEWWTEESDRDE